MSFYHKPMCSISLAIIHSGMQSPNRLLGRLKEKSDLFKIEKGSVKAGSSLFKQGTTFLHVHRKESLYIGVRVAQEVAGLC